MTVSAVNSSSGPLFGTGSATVFPFTFDAGSIAEVEVRVDGVVITTGFTVTLGADEGGSVTFVAPPVDGSEIVISSNPAFDQEISFTDAGQFLPSTHDAALDQAARRDIYLKDMSLRSIRVPRGDSITELPEDRAGRFLAFDSNGNPVASTGTGADAGLRTDLAAQAGASLIGIDGGGTLDQVTLGAGNSNHTAGSIMQIDWLLNHQSVIDPKTLGGLWASGTRAHIVEAMSFNSASLSDDSNSPIGGGPLFNKVLLTVQDGAEGDVVGLGTLTHATHSNCSMFGGNIVLSSDAAITGVKAIGMEIDLALTAPAAAGSALWVANAFNYAHQAVVLQTGGINSGTFQNGFITSSIRGSHYGVLVGDPTASISFIDTSNGNFTNAIRLGRGAGQCVSFGPLGFGTDPIIFSDSGHNLMIDLGLTDILRITDHAGSTKFEFDAAGLSLKVNGTKVLGVRDTGWAADTGTAKKTANATYVAGSTLTYSASYVQAEQTAMATRMAAVEAALQNVSQAQKAVKDAQLAHGLIGA